MLNKNNSALLFILFLGLNFMALYIGASLMGDGPQGDWYQSLTKAPWTPPGFMFGLAWTTIMITFAVFMKNLVIKHLGNLKLIVILYAIQLVLNIGWNYVFFYNQLVLEGLIVIAALLILVWYIAFKYSKINTINFGLILPYGLWLSIATTLNFYVLVNN